MVVQTTKIRKRKSEPRIRVSKLRRIKFGKSSQVWFVLNLRINGKIDSLLTIVGNIWRERWSVLQNRYLEELKDLRDTRKLGGRTKRFQFLKPEDAYIQEMARKPLLANHAKVEGRQTVCQKSRKSYLILRNVKGESWLMTWINEKAFRETRKHYALAIVRRSQKNFTPPQTPSRGRGTVRI